MRLWVRFQLFPCYSHFCTTAKHWALTLSQAFCAMLSNMCACARNVIIPSPTPPHPAHPILVTGERQRLRVYIYICMYSYVLTHIHYLLILSGTALSSILSYSHLASDKQPCMSSPPPIDSEGFQVVFLVGKNYHMQEDQHHSSQKIGQNSSLGPHRFPHLSLWKHKSQSWEPPRVKILKRVL